MLKKLYRIYLKEDSNFKYTLGKFLLWFVSFIPYNDLILFFSCHFGPVAYGLSRFKAKICIQIHVRDHKFKDCEISEK